MRSVIAEDMKVGLLLFDEPSASLDPVAEHGKELLRVREGVGTAEIGFQQQTYSIDFAG